MSFFVKRVLEQHVHGAAAAAPLTQPGRGAGRRRRATATTDATTDAPAMLVTGNDPNDCIDLISDEEEPPLRRKRPRLSRIESIWEPIGESDAESEHEHEYEELD